MYAPRCTAARRNQEEDKQRKRNQRKKGAFVDLADDDDGGLEYRETRVWFGLEVECINAQETQLI